MGVVCFPMGLSRTLIGTGESLVAAANVTRKGSIEVIIRYLIKWHLVGVTDIIKYI